LGILLEMRHPHREEGGMSKSVRERVGILGLVTIVGLFASVAAAKEKRITMDDLPSAVRAAAQKMTAGGDVRRVDVEQEDGRDEYSVEAKVSGKTKEFTFSADGILVAEEEDIALKDVPEAVRTAAEKHFGGVSGLSASKEVAGGTTTYEIEGQKGGKRISLRLSASGALLKEESEDDDED
jgi:uncharacterized membrane protein YkoI